LTKEILAISNHEHFLGGGEHSFLDLLSHLPSDWQPMAVTPHEGELAARLKQRGIATRALPLPSIRPWTIIQVFCALNVYLRLCRKLSPSLIYANGSRAAIYGGLVGRILRVPVLWHCRIAQSDPHLDPLLARLSTRIVTNSQATADRFSPRFQMKTSKVYNGLDIEWLQRRSVPKPSLIQDEWKIILTVARISKWKRHDLVLSAFEQVAESDPMLHLVCLGSIDDSEPDWWAYLQERTRVSPFSKRVHWIGHVDDVRPWYRAAYTSVLASEREPFGRVIVESMACGVPVIATRAGGVPEIICHQQDGLLVAPDSVEELIEAIMKILQDKFLRERLSKSAQLRAESFSLERHILNMIQVFEQTITS